MSQSPPLEPIPAIEVNQWLDCWNNIKWENDSMQSKPESKFYLFSMRASWLKALTGVYRRTAKEGIPRSKDQNIQRGHEQDRSKKIQDYVQHGYPACDLSEKIRHSDDNKSLFKPGWLPTAIVINILTAGSKRDNQKIKNEDLVRLSEQSPRIWNLELPNSFNQKWIPQSIYPFEVIDGQHRLWAFEDFPEADEFELPVVAYHGLDRSWQAYLFWSINITPKRINKSLAFDLYPLLRREDWLDRFSGHAIYKETRAQELVEALWLHPESPWYNKINMLGGSSSAGPAVSQAAWIRSLLASFIKTWSENKEAIGGLYGAQTNKDNLVLPWNRAMQAAFLIYAGSKLLQEINKSKSEWAIRLRGKEEYSLLEDLQSEEGHNEDKAFYGKESLLSTDQGIRGFLYILNDLTSLEHKSLTLTDWDSSAPENTNVCLNAEGTNIEAITDYIKSLSGKLELANFIDDLSTCLAAYDWSRASAKGLPENIQVVRATFKGSSGYKAIRKDLLHHLSKNGAPPIQKAALKAIKLLKLEL